MEKPGRIDRKSDVSKGSSSLDSARQAGFVRQVDRDGAAPAIAHRRRERRHISESRLQRRTYAARGAEYNGNSTRVEGFQAGDGLVRGGTRHNHKP
jgi:hypothetical protein